MRYINLFVYMVLLAAVHTAGAQPNPVPGLKNPVLRIVVIGSSTAAGTGAEPIDSAWVNRYRHFLQQYNPANTVFNLALGGYQTYHLMPSNSAPPGNRPFPDTLRNITKALALQPDAILLNLPSNDAAAGYSLAEQLANFDTILQTAAKVGVPVWICSTQPRNFSADQVRIQRQVLDSMVQRYDHATIDFWEGLASPNGCLRPELDAGDGIHLNNAGHYVLFSRVVEKNIPEMLYYRKPVLVRLRTGKTTAWKQLPARRLATDRTRVFDGSVAKICTPLLTFNGVLELPGIYWTRVQEALFSQLIK
jgi:lysophospholipase L1-like esterase